LKNKKNTLKVLLDTSFILPTLGIDTGIEVKEALKKLDELNAEVYYSIFNILESLWVAIRLIKKQEFEIERFKLGLRSLIESKRYKQIIENTEVFNYALSLYLNGHTDMIDNILYANSIIYDIKFLTIDEEIKKFIKIKNLKDTILSLS
jgi:predicted nucleic acid-binding protein